VVKPESFEQSGTSLDQIAGTMTERPAVVADSVAAAEQQLRSLEVSVVEGEGYPADMPVYRCISV